MRKFMKLALCSGSIALSSSVVMAGYTVTGKYEGNFCTGFVVYVCGPKQIDAASKDGKQLYELPMRFDDVDEYRETGRCYNRVRSSWFNWILGDIPTFYRYVSGPRHLVDSYDELGTPESMTFQCQKE